MKIEAICPGCGEPGLHPTYGDGCISALKLAIAGLQRRGMADGRTRAARRQRTKQLFKTDDPPGAIWRKSPIRRKLRQKVLTRKSQRWKVMQETARILERAINRARYGV